MKNHKNNKVVPAGKNDRTKVQGFGSYSRFDRYIHVMSTYSIETLSYFSVYSPRTKSSTSIDSVLSIENLTEKIKKKNSQLLK